MSVDVFGRQFSATKYKLLRGPPGKSFPLTDDGHYDMKQKRLCNLGDVMHDGDAVSLKSLNIILEGKITSLVQSIHNLQIAVNHLEADVEILKYMKKTTLEDSSLSGELNGKTRT